MCARLVDIEYAATRGFNANPTPFRSGSALEKGGLNSFGRLSTQYRVDCLACNTLKAGWVSGLFGQLPYFWQDDFMADFGQSRGGGLCPKSRHSTQQVTSRKSLWAAARLLAGCWDFGQSSIGGALMHSPYGFAQNVSTAFWFAVTPFRFRPWGWGQAGASSQE